MITFKPIIIPGNRRKDGTWPVVIRVTFNGKSRRLSTTLVCRSTDITRTHRIKDATILTKAEGLIGRMRDAVKDISPFDLDARDVDWVVGRIKDSLSGEDFHLDFFDYAGKFVSTKAITTRNAYHSALNAFARFLGKREVDINAITRPMLLEFMEMVDNEPRMHYDRKTGQTVPSRSEKKIPMAASSRHITKLEHIFNAARDRYNDEDADRILIPKNPFSRITKVHPPSIGQRNLGEDLMQRIISAQVDSSPMRTALDVFILSFGLMGANMADLYYAKPFTGQWVYNRQKTGTRRADQALMKVTIPEELNGVLGRLQGEGGWWLNGLHSFASSKDFCTARVNRCLRQWCEENGVETFTFYAARHTWATLARKAGVDKSTVDDCLAHIGDYKATDIYAEKAWDLIQEANRKVIGLFTW